MVIYLNQYRKTGKVLIVASREREKLCANRASGATAMLGARDTPTLRLPPLPENLASIDLDAFLDRAYALATQI
ncbi:MAG: hypothetical protein ACK4N4_03450 [Burkholderiales bacterium]